MPSAVDTSAWSGEGTFTQLLIDRLQQVEAIRSIRVEDAPATRSDADYNFISNEIFIEFATVERRERSTRFRFIPVTRLVTQKALTIEGLDSALAAIADIGAPDYADDGMLQYLRAERIVPPYQTRGYKLVELVRIYEAGTARRS
jgi:predicted nucleic-acid-binding protein